METAENQPGLFDTDESDSLRRKIVFLALADFQGRGFELAGRRLALDRLLGAFKRASDRCGADLPDDDEIAETLRGLGAAVESVPGYVAKHPYRVTVSHDLAQRSVDEAGKFGDEDRANA